MQAPAVLARLQSALEITRKFAADHRGVSAVEFAVIAPFMVSLYLGGIDVTDAVSANRKATLVARTVADLVSQKSTISDTDLTNILNASAAVAAPFPSSNLRVVISSVKIDNSGNATIAWSDASQGATARTKDSSIVLDAALAVPNSTLILGEVTYVFNPMFGAAITGTLNLSDRIFMRPRISTCVTRPTTVTTC